ncbi:MAG: mechanosensitive ion channel family protein [Patescibacteria group bacterium]
MVEFLGDSLNNYLIALAVFVSVVLLLKIFEKAVVGRLKKISQKTAVKFDDLLVSILESIGWPLYIMIGAFIALQFIAVPEKAMKYFSYLILVAVVFYVVSIIQKIFVFFLSGLEKSGKVDATTSRLLVQIGRLFLWVIAALVVLQNFGFNITALVAGLGIGGVAIAFAFQNILGDIFAYFSIHFDKPFVIGDFIMIEGDLGVIEKIGIKSTRIRTLWGEELVMSNKELTEKRVHNYKKMEERRSHLNFSVVYETSTEKLKKIPQIINDIFSKLESTRLDRAHFKSFGDYGLVFEVAYYTLTPDYNKYMDIQQELNLAIKSEFEKEQIEFAYPTQKILISKG